MTMCVNISLDNPSRKGRINGNPNSMIGYVISATQRISNATFENLKQLCYIVCAYNNKVSVICVRDVERVGNGRSGRAVGSWKLVLGQ
jgi:hypothetical protein